MIKIDVNELSRNPLVWAVAKSLGYKPAKLDRWRMGYPDPLVNHAKSYVTTHGQTIKFSKLCTDFFSFDFAGHLIEEYRFAVDPDEHIYTPADPNKKWWARSRCGMNVMGPTHAIALLRCLVAANLGPVVNVPEEFF